MLGSWLYFLTGTHKTQYLKFFRKFPGLLV